MAKRNGQPSIVHGITTSSTPSANEWPTRVKFWSIKSNCFHCWLCCIQLSDIARVVLEIGPSSSINHSLSANRRRLAHHIATPPLTENLGAVRGQATAHHGHNKQHDARLNN